MVGGGDDIANLVASTKGSSQGDTVFFVLRIVLKTLAAIDCRLLLLLQKSQSEECSV